MALGGAMTVTAQNTPPGATNLATVGVIASDAHAAEGGSNSGAFSVFRDGPTNNTLSVFFAVAGTAGTADYDPILSSVNSTVIPAGSRHVTLSVNPVDDTLIEGPETVHLRVIQPSSNSNTYRIGAQSNAVVNIEDNDRPDNTNRPPAVEIVMPQDGATFPAPADIWISAHASDSDGFVRTVEFFAGNNSLGITTNNPMAGNPINPFMVHWTNVPAGQYELTAVATDDDGAATRSRGVRITVGGSNTTQPVVNIATVDAQGAEIPVVPPGVGMPQRIDTAVFRVTRTGATNIDLPVFYGVSGTAANGTDYDRLCGRVTIPAGARSADIEVVVIDDFLVEGTESVIVTLEPIACIAIFPPPPDCYVLGQNRQATATILDNDSNHGTNNVPPVVRITAPPNGARFPAPADITIQAETVDPDGYASTVEFFANNQKIGESTIVFIQEPPPGTPIQFEFQWQNVAAGAYSLTARTRNDDGLTAASPPVSIVVGSNNTPTPTNTVPIVTIVARDSFASEGTNFFGTNNTATFLISRTGSLSNALTVSYEIAGTASNGVDYAHIGNTVIISAGERSARVVIDPIDDNLREHIETVVLKLRAGTAAGNVGSAYVVGRPERAAATISDNDANRPPCRLLPDRLFHFCVPHTNGFRHRIEVGTNMVHWEIICTNVVVNGAVHFVDPDAEAHPNRFFRVSPVPALPEE